ncbi:hypothetical protein WME91_33465 [Sorangium sp. So ce269]
MYLLRDEAGQVVFARWGAHLKWGIPRPAAPETQHVTVQRLRLGPTTALVRRPELFIHGRSCFSLPPDQRLEPDGVYLVMHIGPRPIPVIVSLPEPEQEPIAPAFTIERGEINHSCHDHGMLWFVPKERDPDTWFVWNVYAQDGQTRVVGPILGPVPWVYGSQSPRETLDWALDLEREYVVSARAIDLSGNLSDEQRLSFKMEQTSRSVSTGPHGTPPGAKVPATADVLAAVIFALGVLATILLVVKAARAERDATQVDR